MAGKRRIHPVGQRYHRLTIVAEAGTDQRRNRFVMAQCDCGAVKRMRLMHLIKGLAKTCGCRRTTVPPLGFAPIPDLPRYFASRIGEIWGPKGLRKFGSNPDGYLLFSVVVAGAHQTQRVSDCVLRTFHGPRPSGMVARHLDGNMINNAADNLAWGTSLDNEADKRRHGRLLIGERNHQAKLTEDQVRAIRSLGGTMTLKAIASMFGVSGTMVSFIVRRRKWAHVP